MLIYRGKRTLYLLSCLIDFLPGFLPTKRVESIWRENEGEREKERERERERKKEKERSDKNLSKTTSLPLSP